MHAPAQGYTSSSSSSWSGCLLASAGKRSSPGGSREQNAPRSYHWYVYWGLIVLFAFSCAAAFLKLHPGAARAHYRSVQLRRDQPIALPETLVVYVFSNTDPQYLRNLEFFLREGVSAYDGLDYIFVVNALPTDTDLVLPELPSNAEYVQHTNECYDWGSIGWLLQRGYVNVAKYKYFIFMNSSVRGPYRPAYLRGLEHWSTAFLSKLSDSVKLVGATINCEGAPLDGDVKKPWRKVPHVQSYVLATDQVGLEILRNDAGVFACYDNLHDTIYHSELGASKAILDAGYNIDSLMVRYQGVDWRNKTFWGCNQFMNPYGEMYLDGTSLEAMEVMFVKVKQHLLDKRWSSPYAAQKYDEWFQATQEGKPEVHRNDYVANQSVYRLPLALSKAAATSVCFDCEDYLKRNADLPRWPGCAQAFAHFVNDGQFEGRPHRWKCHVPASMLFPIKHGADGELVMPRLSLEQQNAVLSAAGLPLLSAARSAPQAVNST